MSAARTIFCDRIATIRGAIADFPLRDLPSIPLNISHNNSARIIRNGLAVQCFNIFEDFVKARTGEVLSDISSSGIPFQYLPEDFQWATTGAAVKAVDFQMKLRDKADRIRYAQDYCEKICSTKRAPVQLPDIGFFHSTPNISKDHFKDALSAFAVAKPWVQVSGLCSRVGISGLPADNVFHSLAQLRHHAAHNANASVSEMDLSQSLLDATGLALCFDILVSKSSRLISKLKTAHPAGKHIISDHTAIPLRFIKHVKGRFCERKEGGTRCIQADARLSSLLASASKRADREGGALVVFDVTGILCRWVV